MMTRKMKTKNLKKNQKLRKPIITILNQWGYTGMIIENTFQKLFRETWKVEEI